MVLSPRAVECHPGKWAAQQRQRGLGNSRQVVINEALWQPFLVMKA